MEKKENKLLAVFAHQKLPIKFIVTICLGIVIFVLGALFGEGRLGIQFGDSQNQNLPEKLNYSSVNQVYSLIKNDYDGKLATNQLLDGLKEGLAQATGDPYTEYFNATQAHEFNNQLNGTFSGIGAELGVNNNQLEIIAPLAGTPAAKADLQPKDIIIAINGKSTTGMSIDQGVSDIRGPVGSTIKLTVLRGSSQLNFDIIRDNITVPSVNWQILPGNIAYIQINQFSNDTSNLATKAAQKIAQDHVHGIILDLRNNPGGLVSAAVDVTSLWLPYKEVVMQEKKGLTIIQTYYSNGNNLLKGIPTVVLINAGSASAAEITSGALHDNKTAYLIGVTSFGKGSVQQIDNLANGNELKVTVAHWYRPNGQNINHIGITPDQVLQMSNADATSGNDTQLNAAINYLNTH